MKIFICWSDGRSYQLAEAIRQWLPKVVPGVEPFLSSDIPKGVRWFEEISRQLDEADAGLICLTPENLRSPWIHFEAGALAKAFQESRIYTYLYSVEPGELQGPLAAFQYTRSSREDTHRLIQSIVQSLGDQQAQETWQDAFDIHWEALEEKLRALEFRPITDTLLELERLFQRKTFNEPLDECTTQFWLDRYSGAVETLGLLERHQQTVQGNCHPYLVDLYNELIGQVDGYVMDMRAFLLEEKRFDLSEDGKLNVFSGILIPCERRRKRINQLVLQILAPDNAPILDVSRRYARLNSIDERKTLLIHPTEQRIKEGELVIAEDELKRCATSAWEFDRVVYYLVQENVQMRDTEQLIAGVRRELEKLRSRDEQGSLTPLHYALRALRANCSHLRQCKQEIEDLFRQLEVYLGAAPGRDQGGHIREDVAVISKCIDDSVAESLSLENG